MALQAGLATSKILIIVGASLAGTVLLKNGTLSDFLGDSYQILVKHLKNESASPAQRSVDPNLLAQLNRLRQELSHLTSERSTITVVTGSSKGNGAIVSVAIPALLVGATGYGYLRWRGCSLSDLMYVTRHSMSAAVASVSKQLEQVSTALSATKRHLASRLEHLSSNLDQSIELQGELKNEITEVRGDVARYGLDIETVQRLVKTLGVKIDTIENKQDIANCGVIYLCNFVERMHVTQQPEPLQGVHRPRLERASFGSTGLKGLHSISDGLQSPELSKDTKMQSEIGVGIGGQSPSLPLQRNLTSRLSMDLPRSSSFLSTRT